MRSLQASTRARSVRTKCVAMRRCDTRSPIACKHITSTDQSLCAEFAECERQRVKDTHATKWVEYRVGIMLWQWRWASSPSYAQFAYFGKVNPSKYIFVKPNYDLFIYFCISFSRQLPDEHKCFLFDSIFCTAHFHRKNATRPSYIHAIQLSFIRSHSQYREHPPEISKIQIQCNSYGNVVRYPSNR